MRLLALFAAVSPLFAWGVRMGASGVPTRLSATIRDYVEGGTDIPLFIFSKEMAVYHDYRPEGKGFALRAMGQLMVTEVKAGGMSQDIRGLFFGAGPVFNPDGNVRWAILPSFSYYSFVVGDESFSLSAAFSSISLEGSIGYRTPLGEGLSLYTEPALLLSLLPRYTPTKEGGTKLGLDNLFGLVGIHFTLQFE